MAPKRKATSHAHENSAHQRHNKRSRRSYIIVSSSETEDSDISEGEYLIKCILDENKSQYLIDWDGPWTPTWEPKENANDVAVQVWERKKRGAVAQREHRAVEDSQLQSSTSIIQSIELQDSPIQVVPSSVSDDSAIRSVSYNFESAQTSVREDIPPAVVATQSTERPVERYSASQRSISPLFVTPDPWPSGNDGEAPDEIPETQLAGFRASDLVSSAERGRSFCGQAVSNGEVPYSKSPFEYIPRSSISSELKLPGEVEIATNREISLRPSAYPDSSKSNGSLTSDSTDSADEIKYIEPFNCQQLETKTENDEADEIAETQSAVWAATESQPTPPELDAGDGSAISPSHVISSGQPCPADCSRSSVLPSSLNTTAVAAYHGNSDPKSILAGASLEPRYRKSTESSKMVLPQSESMEKYSHIPGSTLSEKMKHIHAEMQAKVEETRNTLRASVRPSESPARASSAEMAQPLGGELGKESVPPPAQMNAPFAEPIPRQEEPYPKPEEAPVQIIHPSALSAGRTEPAPGSVKLGPSEFAIPLPMDSRVKDSYEGVLKRDARSIRDFMSGFEPSSKLPEAERLAYKMNEVIEELGNITTHPDINMIEDIRYSQSDLEHEASWGEYSSSKFLLLGYLLRLASDRDLHFVIMVHTPKLLEILERFLLGKGLTYTRPRHEMGPGTDSELSMAKGSLSFGIQTAGNDGVAQTYKPPSMIIALDRAFNAQTPSVEHMRTTYAWNGNLLPVIRLLISNSSEHIERCLPDVSSLQRLRLLIHHTTLLLDAVGDLQDDALNVQEDVEEILACLSSDNFNAHWSLPLIEPLPIVGPDELDSIMAYNQGHGGPEGTSIPEPASQKRSAQMEETVGQVPKRQRREVIQAVAQLNESPDLPSQTLDTDLKSSETKLNQMKTSQANELDQVKQALSDTESRLQEGGKILGELQHRYESRTQEMHKIREERDSLSATKLTLEQRVERQKDEITKLKDERTELKRDLAQARETIKNGGGSAAELEAANEEIRRLTRENAGLERKADYEKNQSEYTREQYQNASTAAAQSATEILELKSENETLKRKVEGEASRLRELNMTNDQERHLSRVKELELTLASRDDLLQKKEDELRELRKNRPSTRSTSVQPRSPKWSTNSRPPSPGLNNNHNGSNSLGRGSFLRFSSEMH